VFTAQYELGIYIRQIQFRPLGVNLRFNKESLHEFHKYFVTHILHVLPMSCFCDKCNSTRQLFRILWGLGRGGWKFSTFSCVNRLCKCSRWIKCLRIVLINFLCRCFWFCYVVGVTCPTTVTEVGVSYFELIDNKNRKRFGAPHGE
jgi:hypothetical protein